MPTYDYRCKDCGHEFEIEQSFSEDSLTVCPECEGNLRKVFSPVGISFKGSGFYKNDASGKSTSTTPAATTSSDSSSSGSSSKSDSSTSSSSSSKDSATSSSTSS